MSEQETRAPQPDGHPRVFAPLPDRPNDQTAAFHGHLAELINLIGADLPPAANHGREWERYARAAVREVLHGRLQIPERIFDALLRAGIYDPDPSFNRQFIEPTVTAFGRRRVKTALIGYLRSGSNQERAGAARAWYWTGISLRYRDWEARILTPESQAEVDAVADLVAEWREAALREFVANDDLDVRRCILPGLPLNQRDYPAELHGLVAEAVRIARTHPDEYIRHRVEHQVH